MASALKSFKISPDVISENLDGEQVILHLASKTYFGLNPTGTRVWQFLETGTAPETMIRQLSEEYAAPPEKIRRQLSELLQDLKRNRLIEDA